MVKVKVDDTEMYMDGYLKSAMDDLKTFVDKKWDGVGFFGGFEGDGKTTIANQCAKYVDPTFNLSKVVFSSKQFKAALAIAKPKECIVFDESYMSFSSKRHNSRESAQLTAILTTIRKKQLFIFFVAPSFFDIQKYLAIWRSRFLINVYSQEFKRGFFSFYSRNKKKDLYIRGKQHEDMTVVTPDFRGRFTGFEPLEMVEYEKKKDEAINELLSEQNQKKKLLSDDEIVAAEKMGAIKLLDYLQNNNFLKQKTLATIADDYFKLSESHVREMRCNLRKKAKIEN